MRDLPDFDACFARLLSLGYSRRTALRLARWCVDESQPAPGWTHHKEETQ